MKRTDIRILSIAVGIALTGLIGIQLYWISNAVTLKEQTFDQHVSEALRSVAYKLEKKGEAARITRRLNFRKQGIRMLGGMDSLGGQGKMVMDNTGDTKKFRFTPNKLNIRVFEQLTIDSAGVSATSSNRSDYTLDSSEAFQAGLDFPNKKTSRILANGRDSMDERLKAFFHRSDMMNDIFDELVSINVYNDAHVKIDTLLLDSLLKTEFLERGIYADYEFGLIENNECTTICGEKKKADLTASKFKTNLNPDNVFIQPRFLSVYFPRQKNYILGSMWLMLSGSGLLILTLIIGFYFTVSTILKQKKLSEIKNDFISNMTHEFKTPISTISLACEVLGDHSFEKSQERVNNYVRMIKEENKRLGALVENILQTAILDKGEFKLKLQDIDVHQVIQQAIQNIHLQVEQKNGKLTTTLSALQPVITADKVHLTNIIYNLIDNALKYSHDNPEINITTGDDEQHLTISVKDNGIGISKENQKKIFDTLYRVPTGNVHNVKGFGLGLSYVKAVVEKHGGTVTVQSELNKGSIFTIVLPVKKTTS